MEVYRDRREYLRQWRQTNRDKVRSYDREREHGLPTVIGVDGEGITTEDGKHLYTYLAAWGEEQAYNEVSNPVGLRPEQCFEALLAVKTFCPNSLFVGFSLGYDYTKWCEGMPTKSIYRLARPEVRQGVRQPKSVHWNGYALNYLRGRFTITRLTRGRHNQKCTKDTCEGCIKGASVAIWDVWGFFQGSFIDACKNWGVIDTSEYTELKAMKERRPTFSMQDWEEVKDYCGKECRKLASLVVALRQAHIDAGLPLRSYYGAGSTASVLLKKMQVKEYMPREHVPEMQHAISCAFFGGRFEISRIGPINEKVYSYDIASAYPYQLYHLPCLACGTWTLAKGRNLHSKIARARAALVHYVLPRTRSISVHSDATSPEQWGPFPLRTLDVKGVGPLGHGIEDGNIVYPVTSGGGWTYKDEYLAACEGWSNVKAVEAWIYHTDCDHHPFRYLSEVYCERLRWGKDSRGIVVKLGPNSCYGKIAQSIGVNPPFQCFLWAGMITSGCRAQLLRLIMQNRPNILMTATDGIVSRVRLERPEPLDTGTRETATAHHKEQLGGWEEKVIEGGIHLIRPGIAFPLEGSIEKETKARGVGKAVLTKHRQAVIDSWLEHGPRAFSLNSTLFHGFKSCTTYHPIHGYGRNARYGLWSRRPQSVSYMPEPKRPFVIEKDGTLHSWAFGPEVVSAPYDRILSNDAKALIEQKILMSEQPDREDSIDEF